jgi:hypothetical protein
VRWLVTPFFRSRMVTIPAAVALGAATACLIAGDILESIAKGLGKLGFLLAHTRPMAYLTGLTMILTVARTTIFMGEG